MFRTNIYGPLDRGMAVLQLWCWKYSHKENFAADFFRQKWTFIQKTKNCFSSHDFGDL